MCCTNICLAVLEVINSLANICHLDLHFGADIAARVEDIAALFGGLGG